MTTQEQRIETYLATLCPVHAAEERARLANLTAEAADEILGVFEAERIERHIATFSHIQDSVRATLATLTPQELEHSLRISETCTRLRPHLEAAHVDERYISSAAVIFAAPNEAYAAMAIQDLIKEVQLGDF
jgi:hypothetical protein